MKRKCLAVGIILLFVGTCIIPAIAQDTEKPLPTSRGKWLYVGGSGPGNYTTIQSAIDAANPGDTIFVYDDSAPYYENVVVNISINLIGENRDTTIIDGSRMDNVVYVSVNQVTITDFTIQNSGNNEDYNAGINMHSSYNLISGCNVSNNWHGILLENSSNNTITNNIVNSNGHDGIFLIDFSSDNIVSNNTASFNLWGGIRLGDDNPEGNVTNNLIMGNNASYNIDDGIGSERSSVNNTIMANILIGNKGNEWSDGISLFHSNYCTVTGNIVTGNNRSGIGLEDSHNNTIKLNNIDSNNFYGLYLQLSDNNLLSNTNVTTNKIFGISLAFSSGNKIYNNNFIKNKIKAFFTLSKNNKWNGNFWNRFRILPVPIFGLMKIGFLIIPWVNFDCHPAKEPYDIP